MNNNNKTEQKPTSTTPLTTSIIRSPATYPARFFARQESYQGNDVLLTTHRSLNSSDDEPPPQYQLRRIPRWKIALVIGFDILYLPNAVNLDGFLVKELAEFLTHNTTTSLVPWVVGCSISVPHNFFWMLTITSILLRLDRDDHVLNADEEPEELVYGNPWLNKIRDLITIGVVSGLITYSGFLDTVDSITELVEHRTPPLIQVLFPAIIAGCIDGFADATIYGRFVNEAVYSSEGNYWFTRLGRSLITTYFTNVWTQPGVANKLKYAYLIYGILVASWMYADFATDVAGRFDGLNSLLGDYEWILNVVLAIPLAFMVANTKARNVAQLATRHIHPNLAVKAVLMSSAAIYALPAPLQLAKFFGREDGPGEGLLYNSLIFAASSALLLPPFAYGFYATVVQGAHDIALFIGRRWYGTTQESTEPIIAPVAEDDRVVIDEQSSEDNHDFVVLR